MSVKQLAVSKKEAEAMIGVRKDKMAELLHSGQIRSVRVGRRIIIPVAALEEFLERGSATEGREQ